jgi:hypothetical protein
MMCVLSCAIGGSNEAAGLLDIYRDDPVAARCACAAAGDRVSGQPVREYVRTHEVGPGLQISKRIDEATAKLAYLGPVP